MRKRYPIAAIAAIFCAVFGTSAIAQTRFIPLEQFKPDRIAVHKKVDTAKHNRCRGHAAPFRYRAWEVPVRLRPAALSFWRYRLTVARDKSSRCFAVRMWRWFNTSGAACIHSLEGAWNDPDAPYWGGFQADLSFQRAYGGEYLRRWGTADKWPPLYQVHMAYRGHQARGWSPWPNTAAACGLL